MQKTNNNYYTPILERYTEVNHDNLGLSVIISKYRTLTKL